MIYYYLNYIITWYCLSVYQSKHGDLFFHSPAHTTKNNPNRKVSSGLSQYNLWMFSKMQNYIIGRRLIILLLSFQIDESFLTAIPINKRCMGWDGTYFVGLVWQIKFKLDVATALMKASIFYRTPTFSDCLKVSL